MTAKPFDSPAERAAALARCEAATEGPWLSSGVVMTGLNLVGRVAAVAAKFGGKEAALLFIPMGSRDVEYRGAVADKEFVAHVRTDYPRLEATLRAVEAERDAAQKSVIELAKHANSTIASFNTTITSLRQELKDQVFRNEAQAVEITELVAALRQITYDLDADKYRSDMRGRAYGIASESIAKAESKP